MKVKSESEVVQSCPTLSMDCSLPASSVRGIFQARVLEWGAIVTLDSPKMADLKSEGKNTFQNEQKLLLPRLQCLLGF